MKNRPDLNQAGSSAKLDSRRSHAREAAEKDAALLYPLAPISRLAGSSSTGEDAGSRIRRWAAHPQSHANRISIARFVNQTMGNRVLQLAVDPVQRNNDGNQGSWSIPFGGGTATTRPQVQVGLGRILSELSQLQGLFDEGEYREAFNEKYQQLRNISRQMQGEDPIDAIEAGILSMFGTQVSDFHRDKLAIIRSRVQTGYTSLSATPGDTSQEESRLAERLHYAFIESNESTLGDVRQALDGVKKYAERVNQVAALARQGAQAIRAARTASALERAAGGSQAVANMAGKVSNVLRAARFLTHLSGLETGAVGASQRSIDQFATAMDAVDLAMSFSSGIPLIGQLWSSYYKPIIDAIIPMLRVIARAEDREVRQLALLEWMQSNPGGGQAPTIPAGMMSYFPGGQPVLNFMFTLVNSGSPSPTSAVEAFFLEHRDLFNVGLSESEQLEREGPVWYNPFTWGSEERLTNLMSWIDTHASTVWAMLYGDLPHSLSA